MKGTRLQTMASVLVTLAAPAAYAVVSHPSEDSVYKKHQSQESFSPWQIPPPGQTLARVASASPLRETVGALGAVLTVDPVTQAPKSRFGRLPLQLQQSFGGTEAYEKWIGSVEKSADVRTAFAHHLESQLRHFISNHRSELKVDGLKLSWDAQRFYIDGQHAFASFFVGYGDTLLEGAELSFRFNEGQLVSVVTKTFGVERAHLVAFKFDTEQVAKAARAVLGPSAQVISSSVQKRWVPRVSGAAYTFDPTYKFEARSATGEVFTVLAHAERNEILSWNANTIFFDARIEGVVNQRTPNGPQATVGMPYVQGQVRSGGWFGRSQTFNANSAGVMQLTGQQSARVQLSSARVKVINSVGNSAEMSVTGDALFDGRTNSTLAENTTYYHLHVAQNWARPVINPKWFSSQLVANVNIGDICNAFWNGKSVNFFQAGSKKTANGKTIGCSNTGENADVVYHEWGHGLHHNTGGIRDRAFSEGIGDTVSQLITGSADVGPGFFSDGRPVRNLDSNYMYPPKDNEREVHKEGLIFGSTYFHLTQDLIAKYGSEVGRATARQWFLKMLYTASQYTDTYESLLALDSDPMGEDVRGPNYCIINGAYSRHGLAMNDPSCR